MCAQMYQISSEHPSLHPLPPQLQQTVEEKGAVGAQLRAVSQTLRDTQNRCHWLESQVQGQAQVNSPKHVQVCAAYIDTRCFCISISLTCMLFFDIRHFYILALKLDSSDIFIK